MSIAFMFPGQASQYVGMGRALYESIPACRELLDAATDLFGLPLRDLCFDGPPELLTRTDNVQPAIAAVSAMALEALRLRGIHPAIALGHSLGEYVALYAAGTFDFATLIRVVTLRGAAMNRVALAAPGTMIAVMGLSPEKIAEILAPFGERIALANLNSPGQVIVSGESATVAEVQPLLKEAGAGRLIPLNVSGAWHSPLMRPAALELEGFLKDLALATPAIPVIANVTAEIHGAGESVATMLVRQVTSPVRWEESMRLAVGMGVTHFIEVGPGKVLRGLGRQIQRDATFLGVEDSVGLEEVANLLGEDS